MMKAFFSRTSLALVAVFGLLASAQAEELRTIFRKLKAGGRRVVQVVGHPERSSGPALEGTGIVPVEQHRVGPFTLMHRRRIFVRRMG